MKIDIAVITSNATQDRLELTKNWTGRSIYPVRHIGDSDVTSTGYRSAIDKTLFAIASAHECDYLYILDDDGYLVTSRLEAALESEPPCIGNAMGRFMHDDRKLVSIHGGPGFALAWDVVQELQAMISAKDIIRHERNSDLTVAIQLDRLGIVPTNDPRWHTAIPYPEEMASFIACHRVINHPDHLKHLPSLNAQQVAIPSRF